MFRFSEDQQMLGTTVADFAAKELLPLAAKVDEEEGWNKKAFSEIARLGLLGITVDEKYGGSNQGSIEATLVMEKMGEYCASTTLSYLAHAILCVNNIFENASEAQKSKYLPLLVSGEWMGGMGMTEPQAGSDALGMQTRAERKGDHYILKGTKTLITNGPLGDVFVVYARTGSGRTDISTFIVEKSFPGFRVGKRLHKFGMRGSPTSELIFDDCRVPLENLVGNENESVHHMMRNLNIERITISGISLGIAAATLKYVTDYCKERSQFGQHLASFQMTQEKVAEIATQLDAARALVYGAADAYDQGSRQMSLGAKAKLFAGPMATKAALEGIQILGGWGYMKEYPVERYLRDAKLMEIGAGTNEIMRLLIAKEIFGKQYFS